jgi:hypothetical protein
MKKMRALKEGSFELTEQGTVESYYIAVNTL